MVLVMHCGHTPGYSDFISQRKKKIPKGAELGNKFPQAPLHWALPREGPVSSWTALGVHSDHLLTYSDFISKG